MTSAESATANALPVPVPPPSTESFAHGDVVPMPTLPPPVAILTVALVLSANSIKLPTGALSLIYELEVKMDAPPL